MIRRARSGVHTPAIIRIGGLQLAILHHRVQDPRINELSLLHESCDRNVRRLPQLLLHERQNQRAALDLLVLLQIEAGSWGAGAKFPRLQHLPGLVAKNVVAVTEVDAGGGVDVSLEPAGEVVENAVEGDIARAGAACAGDVLDSFIDFVPGVVVFVCFGVLWRFYGVVADD